MKLRSSLLAFACLLLTGSIASAATTVQADTPGIPRDGDAAIMTPTETSPGCSPAELPFMNPSPSEKLGGACGPCSDSPCQGKRVDQICAYSGGKYYTCEVPYGDRCTNSGTITLQCTCWYGPLP